MSDEQRAEWTAEQQAELDQIVEVVGHSLRWTLVPVIHDKPVVEDMGIYLTGDGAPPLLRGGTHATKGLDGEGGDA